MQATVRTRDIHTGQQWEGRVRMVAPAVLWEVLHNQEYNQAAAGVVAIHMRFLISARRMRIRRVGVPAAIRKRRTLWELLRSAPQLLFKSVVAVQVRRIKIFKIKGTVGSIMEVETVRLAVSLSRGLTLISPPLHPPSPAPPHSSSIRRALSHFNPPMQMATRFDTPLIGTTTVLWTNTFHRADTYRAALRAQSHTRGVQQAPRLFKRGRRIHRVRHPPGCRSLSPSPTLLRLSS